MKKVLFLYIIFSVLTFSAGEISFKKQREKEAQEQEKLLKEQGIENLKTVRNNNSKSNIRNKIIEVAKKKIGSPYLWGASGNQKFDCSSFVQYVYKQATGIILPRVSAEQAQFRPKISTVRKGDLLFFETLDKGRISHVGIYVGNGQFIHASSAYKRVIVSEFSGFYKEKFRWAISIL